MKIMAMENEIQGDAEAAGFEPFEDAKLLRVRFGARDLFGDLFVAGLDHFQLSFQSSTEKIAEEISRTKTHSQKLRVLEWLKSRRLGVTLNFVLHRHNLHQMDAMLAIAESSSASRIEFANVQYYGWGFANRDLLLPTRQQLDDFMAKVKSAEETSARKNSRRVRRVGLLRKIPKTVHGRLGPQSDANCAER